MLPFIATLGLAAAVGSDGAAPRGLSDLYSMWVYEASLGTLRGRFGDGHYRVWTVKFQGTGPGHFDVEEFLTLAEIFHRSHPDSAPLHVVPHITGQDPDTGAVTEYASAAPLPEGRFLFVATFNSPDAASPYGYEVRWIPPNRELEFLLGEPMTEQVLLYFSGWHGVLPSKFGENSEAMRAESFKMFQNQLEREGYTVEPGIVKRLLGVF